MQNEVKQSEGDYVFKTGFYSILWGVSVLHIALHCACMADSRVVMSGVRTHALSIDITNGILPVESATESQS